MGSDPVRIAVVTGSRAEFGLLRPVMRAIEDHPGLELAPIVAGAHLLGPAQTYREVKGEFPRLADTIPMQVHGRVGRVEDAEAVGAGIGRFARCWARLGPDWVLVLGDRVEAFAAAASASIGGFAVAHVHGGDRAQGVADEAMRHAITKMAHLHLPATATSAERIIRMGEAGERVHVVGSPAIDGLDEIPPLDETAWSELGRPQIVFLMHPVGRVAEREELAASQGIEGCGDRRVLALHPNHDPGRRGILRAIESAKVPARAHLPRATFVGLLRRLGESGGVLVGNSSAALIEAAALRCPAVDIGSRQDGRERVANVVRARGEDAQSVGGAIDEVGRRDLSDLEHPFGDGRAGPRIAESLARIGRATPKMLRKRCAY